MKLVSIILVLFLCSCEANEQYGSVQEFKSEIDRWSVVGKSVEEAMIIGRANRFQCVRNYCYKDLPGLPCNQRLRIDFVVNGQSIVTKYTIWTIDGKFPTQCL